MTNEQLVYYIDGPGEVLIGDFKNPQNVLAVATVKEAGFSGNATFEKVTGGRSLFARRQYLTEKTLNFRMTDCQMRFQYMEITNGSTTKKAAVENWAFGDLERYTVKAGEEGAKTITLRKTPVEGSLVLRPTVGASIAVAKEDIAAPSADGTVVVTIKSDDIKVGDYVSAIYKYMSAEDVLTTSTRIDSCPKSVFITHKQPCFNKDNEVIGFQYIEIFRAKSDAQFEKAYSEKSPYAPSLNFEVEDAERPDGKLVDEKFEPLAEGLNYFDLIYDNQ